MLGSQRFHCYETKNTGVVDSSKGVGWKGQMPSVPDCDRYRAGILDGHRDRQTRGLWLPNHSHSRRPVCQKIVKNGSRVCES